VLNYKKLVEVVERLKLKQNFLMIRLKYAKSAFLYAFGVDRTLPVQNLVVVAQQVIIL
jgi:hypothetical protein